MTLEPGGEVARVRVVYSGRVQGVFFRATTQQLAQRRPVVGYVRNCRDGSVELEAEGPLDQIEALLADVAAEYEGYITDIQRTTLPPRRDERRFEIRY